MSEPRPAAGGRLSRSPELMNADDTALLVVDVQDKLLPLIPAATRLVWNISRLIDAAQALAVPVVATEQYPQGLGPTTALLAQRLASPAQKRVFSCGECGDLFRGLSERGVEKLLVCGMETHVCVAQTVFDLLASGLRVYVAVDAVAARFAIDHDTALRRMELGGAVLTTVEAAMFEWCDTSAAPQFKRISALVREQPPT